MAGCSEKVGQVDCDENDNCNDVSQSSLATAHVFPVHHLRSVLERCCGRGT